MKTQLLAVAAVVTSAFLCPKLAAVPANRPNVLFIAIDDLRPSLGCYGDLLAKTPNFDRLAREGVVFERAYCQQAVCAPSRNTALTSRRPESLGIYDLPTFFRTAAPDAITLPQYFLQHGYTTARIGKIFHDAHGNRDDAASWREVLPNPPRGVPAAKGKPAVGAPDVGDDELPDGANTAAAIAWLRAKRDQPFFFALGFLKPHLPFIAPKRYWDFHDRAKFPLPASDRLPAGAPPWAGSRIGELALYDGIPKAGPLPAEQTRELTHGYYAAASYIDAQLGRVLAALEEGGLRDNTIVVLWGDHGFQLGENGNWCKHDNFELATRMPLILRAPGRHAPGVRTRGLVELADLYPSLVELAGLPAPAYHEGCSFVPLLTEPAREWKAGAFSLWPWRGTGRSQVGLGRSVRTERYRYTEWTRTATGEVGAVELYDYGRDGAGQIEVENLAGQPALAGVESQMKTLLRGGWKSAQPRLR